MSLAEKRMACIVPGTVPFALKPAPLLIDQSVPVRGTRVEILLDNKDIHNVNPIITDWDEKTISYNNVLAYSGIYL